VGGGSSVKIAETPALIPHCSIFPNNRHRLGRPVLGKRSLKSVECDPLIPPEKNDNAIELCIFFFCGGWVSPWASLASAKEFTGARYCSWMGRRWRKRRRRRRRRRRRGTGVKRKEEGRRAELARPHGKNWICFHSSSNKQWGNFASVHLLPNTPLNSEAFEIRSFRAASRLLWAGYLQEGTKKVPRSASPTGF